MPSDTITGGAHVIVYFTCIVNDNSNGFGYQEYVSFNYYNQAYKGIKKWHRFKFNNAWQSWTLEFES